MVILGVMVDQEARDARHAPDVLEQAGGVLVVHVLRGGHLAEQVAVLVRIVRTSCRRWGSSMYFVDAIDGSSASSSLGSYWLLSTRSKKSKPSSASSSVAGRMPRISTCMP